MRKYLTVLFIFMFCFLSVSATVEGEQKKIKHKIKPVVKILIVNSYNSFHPCTSPQINGFKSVIDKDDSFKYVIRGINMHTKLKNITPEKMQEVANKVFRRVELFKPDIIFTTDDNACRYVGIPLSTKYPVVCSGLNKFPADYIKEYNLKPNKNHIIFISEYIRLDNVWNLFEQNHFFVNTIYIISEPNKNLSTTAYYMLKNYIQETQGHAKIEIRYVEDVYDLQIVLKETPNTSDVLIIPVIQRIKDRNGKIRDKLYITRQILKFNKKFLELGANSQFCRYGLSICNVPDFFGMGAMGGNIVLKYLFKVKLHAKVNLPNWCDVISIANKLSLNQERLYQLGYEMLLSNSTLINHVFERIEDVDDE